MSYSPDAPEDHFATIVEALLSNADVTLGARGKKGFGSSALQINNKIYAMLSSGRLVVKLPQQRVEALIASGEGDPFDPRRNGRLMKEWFSLDPTSELDWLPLAREAMEFVASKS